MSETKFTPGPWSFTNGQLLRVCKPSARPVTICGIHRIGRFSGKDESESVANGRLIAAAPDLYEALTKVSDMLFARPDMVAALRPLMGPQEQAICDAASAALAKARGEP